MKKYLSFRLIFISSSLSCASAGYLYYLFEINNQKYSYKKEDSFKENETNVLQKIVWIIQEKLKIETELSKELKNKNPYSLNKDKIALLKNKINYLKEELKNMNLKFKKKTTATRLIKLANGQNFNFLEN